MTGEFQLKETFVWNWHSSMTKVLQNRLGIKEDSVPAIFALWPLLNHFATDLLQWPIALDFMKLLPQKINLQIHKESFVFKEGVLFSVQWERVPSHENPLPLYSAQVSQEGENIVAFSISFLQRPPRKKPNPFIVPKQDHQLSMQWAKEQKACDAYLEGIECSDPIFHSKEFAVAMGMAQPLVPDLFLIFCMYGWLCEQEKILERLDINFEQPALRGSELILHHSWKTQEMSGVLCDEFDRVIFKEIFVQYAKEVS